MTRRCFLLLMHLFHLFTHIFKCYRSASQRVGLSTDMHAQQAAFKGIVWVAEGRFLRSAGCTDDNATHISKGCKNILD